ncbi:MAG TPA: DUF5686 family protein, partial [Flavobacterium sp.]|nr:DUF5686 family protein [Flavobacterium sp.]
WFPTARLLKITKGDNDEDIKILGETLKFRGEDDISPKTASDFTCLLSESYYYDAQYNIPVMVEKAAIAVEIPDEAINRDNKFWEFNRLQPLDPRSANTYFALDSIASKAKVERRLFMGRKILNGYMPVGFFDIDLRYLLSFNNYEGFRIGFGGITNESFSRKYRIEGYTAYGTKDGNFKYNIGAAARIGKFSNTWIGGSYTDDIREIASTSFAIDKRVFKVYDPRPINVSTFYNFVTWRGYMETKIIPKTESLWQMAYSSIEPEFGYAFQLNNKRYHNFHLTAAMVSLQWNPFSDYMHTPIGRIEIDKRFPKFTFQFTQSVPDVLENDFNFGKIDVRAEYQKNFLNGQKSSFLLEAGYAYGEVPLTHAYNTSPNNLNKDGVIKRITFAGKNSFETMYFNEFFSTRYVFLQFKHALKKVELFRKIRPTPVIVTRMAWGAMDEPQRHLGITYKTLNEGFYESGLELNGIYNGLGLSGFYRYGVNQLPRLEDNISIKLSFVINLGF